MKLLVPSKGPLCKILEGEENATQIKGPYKENSLWGEKGGSLPTRTRREKKGVAGGGSKRALYSTQGFGLPLSRSPKAKAEAEHKKNVAWFGAKKNLGTAHKKGGCFRRTFLATTSSKDNGRDKKGAKVSHSPDPLPFKRHTP